MSLSMRRCRRAVAQRKGNRRTIGWRAPAASTSVLTDGMDSPRFSRHIGALVFIGVWISSSNERSPR